MADSQLGWSDAQWEAVNNAVTEAFDKASVTTAFLPRYGPLPGSAENVRKEKLNTGSSGKITVADDTTLKLFNLRVFVELSSEQVADGALSSALLAFRRAANTLAQVEDHIVFNGYQTPAPGVGAVRPGTGTVATTGFADEFVASDHPAYSEGLSVPTASTRSTAKASKRPSSKGQPSQSTNGGELIVTEIVKAIGALESKHHPGPFAAVLGETLFVQAYTPNSALVLPADRIKPLVNGPLLRSARLLGNRGVVVSLAAGAIDIVAATPAKVQFLQVTDQARYLFRVYERVVLRIKDATDTAVHDFQIDGL